MKVPAITTNPPSSSNAIKPKKSGVFITSNSSSSMASSNSGSGVAPQNPTTPVIPRIRASQQQQQQQQQRPIPRSTPRSPKSTLSSRKSRAETVASPDPYYNHHSSLSTRHHVAPRPSSAASNRSFVPGGAAGGSTTGRLSRTGRDSPMFFHASEASGPTYTSAPHVASSGSNGGPKFFHADGASVDSPSEQPLRIARAPRVLSASPQIGVSNGPVLNPTSSRNVNISPPTSRPASMVGYPASPRPAPRTPSLAPSMGAENRAAAKFVYANGTEELLHPRKPSGSEIGSAITAVNSPSSPKFTAVNSGGAPSPKVAYPLSPLASPGLSSPPHYFQRHVSGTSSRRASLDAKSRHGRNASISSVIDLSSLKKEEIGHADDEGHSGNEDTGSEEEEDMDEFAEESEQESEYVPPAAPIAPVLAMTAAERIKLMEERSANSRRERKVMDLEISNASLLAINKTLEKEMRRQTAELRRYKRLARSGRLSIATNGNHSSTSKSGKSDSDAASIVEGEDWEVHESEEDEDTETEKLSEEDAGDSEASNDDGKHAEADEKRLTLDLSKHQALLDASSKMNKSLRGCLLITDQLIKEGKKALEYKVRASDVRIGGRILRDEDEESENLDLESIDGDGLLRSERSGSVSMEGTSAEDETDDPDAEETETEDEDASAMAGLGLGIHHGGSRPFLLRPEELQPVRHSLV